MDIPQDWIVNPEGECLPLAVQHLDASEDIYRLYRFLTEVEDILKQTNDDCERLAAIAPRVRQLLISSYWLQMEFTPPPEKPGWSVKFLYREHGFPLTVQMVAWRPNNISPIHNHGCWGIVAILGGEEKNRIWRRSPTADHPDRIELVTEKVLVPGDIITFLPDAIHSVEPMGEEPAITFNLYGVTDFSKRFEFDPMTHTARKF
jgi:predicted metal-dependent enzyme (double-stranded beta helix superfamily)